jgi:MacB-like periplasmic core domain
LPGVVSVAASSATPWSALQPSLPFALTTEARPGAAVAAEWRSVTPGVLATLGLRLRSGRFLAAADRNGTPRVAVVDARLASELWGSSDPLGRSLQAGAFRLTVVGVVDPLRDSAFEAAGNPVLLVPYLQWPWREMSFLLKTRNPEAGSAAVAVLRRLAPELACSPPRALAEDRQRAVAGSWPTLAVLAFFGLAALLLAAVAVYRVVAERGGDIGLGPGLDGDGASRPPRLLSPGLEATLWGGAVGGILVLFMAPRLTAPLGGASPWDPTAHAAGWALLAGSAALATRLAARRAARPAASSLAGDPER